MNVVYPRTFRVVYAQNPVPQFAVSPDHGHAETVPPAKEITEEIDCHCTRVDGYFLHFAIIKRYDERRDIPIWMYRKSIPIGLVRSVEMIHDESAHAVPMEAMDLDKLVTHGDRE